MCIMAYGQTGSGKTFTMMGPADNMGVNRRAIREVLALCSKASDVEYTVKVAIWGCLFNMVFSLALRALNGLCALCLRRLSPGVLDGGLQRENL